MAMLLGDVGGTNARLAIARNGVIDDNTVTRFRGDDFASFDDVVRRFQKVFRVDPLPTTIRKHVYFF